MGLGGRRGLGRTGLPYKLCFFTKRGLKALSCGNQLMLRGVDSTCSQVSLPNTSVPNFTFDALCRYIVVSELPLKGSKDSTVPLRSIIKLYFTSRCHKSDAKNTLKVGGEGFQFDLCLGRMGLLCFCLLQSCFPVGFFFTCPLPSVLLSDLHPEAPGPDFILQRARDC